MNEVSKTYLPEQTKFRLSEITGIENYFHQEIHQGNLCIKKLSKYVTFFDYIDEVLIFFFFNYQSSQTNMTQYTKSTDMN